MITEEQFSALLEGLAPDLQTELWKVFRDDPTVTTLGLSYKAMGDNGVRAIAQALKSNTNLKMLSLGGNIISDAGALQIAEALK